MPSPIILDFHAGDSLTSLNSIAVGAGVAYGTMTLPFVALDFHNISNLTAYYNGNATYAASLRIDNRQFYDNQFAEAPFFQQRMFYCPPRTLQKTVKGFVFGISEGGIFEAAGEGISGAMRSATRAAFRSSIINGSTAALGRGIIITWLRRILSSVGLDAMQTSQSTTSTLHGLNRNDMYQFDINQFDNSRLNVLMVQASIGAGVSAALNLLIMGHFRSYNLERPLFDYLTDVSSQAFACTIIGDAAAGLIFPGAQLQFICS